jgi:hypothetical protein
LEEVTPVVSSSELSALHANLESQQQDWELSTLQKLKEEEETRNDEDDEMLFYEVV